MRPSARAHVIFGMDLKKANRLRRGGNRSEMGGLEPRSGPQWKLRNAHGLASVNSCSLLPLRGARMPRAPRANSGLDRLQRSHAMRGLHRFAGSLGNIFPSCAFIIDCRLTGAAVNAFRCTIVLALERDP